MKTKNKSFFPKYTAIICGVLTAAICGVMNLFLIPATEANTGGIRCFDMNIGYDYQTAREFLRLIGERGRHIYLDYLLPLDFIFPVVYTLFFISLIFVLKKTFSPLMFLPLALAAADYTENIFSEIMLRSAVLPEATVKIACAATVAKTGLMCLVILSILIMIAAAAVRKLKFRKGGQSPAR